MSPKCFHSIGIPSEWGRPQYLDGRKRREGSCFHSIGIPSEWGLSVTVENGDQFEKWFPFNWDPQRVGTSRPCPLSNFNIRFPFNWDPQRVGTGDWRRPLITSQSFHSIGIPSEWGQHLYLLKAAKAAWRFHSIGIPSEWGLALGADIIQTYWITFPFNWDPQRVGTPR